MVKLDTYKELIMNCKKFKLNRSKRSIFEWIPKTGTFLIDFFQQKVKYLYKEKVLISILSDILQT